MINGRVVNTDEIEGVVTRLPYVQEDELRVISAEDRPFVASEIHAFLVSWLSSLRCPVLNAPTPACLCGPNWRLEEWLHAAAMLGIPVLSTNHRGGNISLAVPNIMTQTYIAELTVVGPRFFGCVNESLDLVRNY